MTEAEVEQAVTNADVQQRLLEAAEHQVEQAQANLAQERDRLGKTTILAPMSGRVTRLNVERGETAIVGTMNNPGTVLLTVADLSVMEAVIEVDETDVPDIVIGDSAYIEIDAFPNRRFVGTVTRDRQQFDRSPQPRTVVGPGDRLRGEDRTPRPARGDPPPTSRPRRDVITGHPETTCPAFRSRRSR